MQITFSQCNSTITIIDTVDFDLRIHMEKTTQSYGSNGKMLSSIHELQDPIGSAWTTQNTTEYTYDSNDSLIRKHSTTTIVYPPSLIAYQMEYSYDVFGNLLTYSKSDSTASGWELQNTDTNTYFNNLQLTNIHYDVNYKLKTSNTYDLTGNLESILYKKYSGGSWVDSSRIDFYYDVNGFKQNTFSLFWSGMNWDSLKIGTYHYNGLQLLDTFSTRKFISGLWTNDSLYFYQYGTLNKLINSYSMYWDGSQWLYNMHYITNVDQNGYPSYSEEFYASYQPNLIWSQTQGSFEFTYDSIGNLLNVYLDYPYPQGFSTDTLIYVNGVIAAEHGYYETMGGLYTDHDRTYYYASIVGNDEICNGDTTILSIDTCNVVSILWNNGETTNNILVSSPGIYQASITYSNGDTVLSTPFEVFWSNLFPYFQNVTDSTLNICYSGRVNLYSVGQPNVNYQWYRNDSALAGENFLTISQYAFEAYTGDYYLVGSNGCGVDTSAITHLIINPMPTQPTITNTGPTSFCVGDSVILTSSPCYSYLWLPNGETTQSITAYHSGTYTVRSIDSIGCFSARNISITENQFSTTNYTIVYNAGMLATNPNSGTGIQWYYNGVAISGATSWRYSPTNAGNYYFTYTNYAGCSVYSDTILYTPSVFAINAGPDEYTCVGGSTYFGSIDPVIGGTPSYNYTWIPSTGITIVGNGRARIDNVTTSQSFILMVRDGIGQIAYDTINIIVYPAIPAELYTSSQVLCAGAYVSVYLNYNTARVSSWIMNGDTISSQNEFFNPTSSSILAAIYTDTNNCILTTPVDTFIFNPRPISQPIHLIPDQNYCYNASGTAWIETNPGSTYLWKQINLIIGTDSLIHFTRPGDYSVVETNSYGCTTSSNFDIDITTNSPSFPMSWVDLSCDSVTGVAPVIQNASYQWYLDGVSLNDTDNTHVLATAGDYLCEMITPDGCIATSSATWWSAYDPDTCVIDTVGNLLFYTGTNTGYTYYQWYLDDVLIPGAINSYIYAVQPGKYTLTLNHNQICKSYSNAIIFLSACGVTINPTTSILCSGVCDGQLSAIVTGTPPFQYTWSNGLSSSSITGLCNGTYQITISDSTLCNSTANFTFISDSISFSLSKWNTSCIGCANGGVNFSIGTVNSPYTISASPNLGVISGDSIFNLPAGIYQFCISDNIGCTSCITDTISEDPTAVIENGFSSILLYPIPTTGKIFLATKRQLLNERFSIENILGEIILDGNVNSEV